MSERSAGARQATAIALELGVHNATLAIAVGATLATTLTVPAAIYSVLMFLTGIGFARLMTGATPGWLRRRSPAS